MRSRMSYTVVRGPRFGGGHLMRAGMNARRRLGLVLRRRRMCCYRQWFRLALRHLMSLLRAGRRDFVMGRRVPCRHVSLFTRPLAWLMLPPIRGAWMVMMPDDHPALMPVAVVV